MNVGLPGTGIGGFFYLSTALLMPAYELLRAAAGRSSAQRWRRAGAQAGLALAILAGLWSAAWLLTSLCPVMVPGMQAASQQLTRMLGVTPTLLTLTTLGALLLLIEGLCIALWLRRQWRRALGAAVGLRRR
jgi:hypothetical protein